MIATLATFLLSLGLGYYLITALQWFSYKFSRVLFHYTRPRWHVYYFALPLAAFALAAIFLNPLAMLAVSVVLVFALALWTRGLSHRLVLTPKVWRFFAALATLAAVFAYFAPASFALLAIIASLALAFALSAVIERVLWEKFKRDARKKLNSMPNLVVVLVTASFGKTSIKNFLFHMLERDFYAAMTPRSVNTLAGIVRDINENLSENAQIYVVEAGARSPGDIAEIARFVRPQYVVVGEIGGAHLEYFGSLDVTRATKLEALDSSRLRAAFLHSTTLREEGGVCTIYDALVSDVSASLDGLEFRLKTTRGEILLKSDLLGEFNAANLAVAALVALELGVSAENVIKAVQSMPAVEHRLQKIEAGGKLIIDDSFNGNLKGMRASYELARTYHGRKVLLTPGIMEGGAEQNEELGRLANECFDLVVLTSALNVSAIRKHLLKPEVYILTDKEKMQEFLAENTFAGDLILFSNDAPSFM